MMSGFVVQSQTETSSFCLTTQIPVLVSGPKSKQQEQGSRVKENLIYRQIRGQSPSSLNNSPPLKRVFGGS